jgi:hypothetical protein
MMATVFCIISGGDDGWYHVEVKADGDTLESAKAQADTMMRRIASGCTKVVREDVRGESQHDFEKATIDHCAWARFSFRDEEGTTEHAEEGVEVQCCGLPPAAT